MAAAPVADSMEAEFARRLAGNDKRSRDKALKKLKQFLNLRSAKLDGGFTRVEMLSIWKGLFYCMWMSDKPLVQEDLAKKISDLMSGLSNAKTAMLFFEIFLETMQREWKGIDRLRMDKFYQLTRFILQKAFEYLKSKNWDIGMVDWLLAILKNGPICPTKPVIGMQYHFCDIYLEELSKTCKDELEPEILMRFLDPYCIMMTTSKNYDIVKAVSINVFQELVENSQPALDLLAEEEGIVNVKGHTQTQSYNSSPVTALKVDYSKLADRLFELASREGVLSRNRKKVFRMVEKFRELSEGRLPLHDIPDAEYSSEDEVQELEDHLTEELVAESGKDMEVKQEYQKSKRRKRKRQVEELVNGDEDFGNSLQNDMNEDEKEDINAIENGEDVENTFSNADTNNNHSNIEKGSIKKKKKKKKGKSIKASVIIGSNIEKESSGSNSQEDVDSTMLELMPSKKKKAKIQTKLKDAEKNTTQPETIPDILQDIEECKQAAEKKLKQKARMESKELLKKWLSTAKDDSDEEEIKIKTSEIANGDIKKTKIKKKNSSTTKNEDADLTSKDTQKQDKCTEQKEENQTETSPKRRRKKRKSMPNPEKVVEGDSFSSLKSSNDDLGKNTGSVSKKNKKKRKSALSKTSADTNNLLSEAQKSEKGITINHNTSDSDKFAQISNSSSLPNMSTFFKVAASKVEKASKNKHLAAVKRKKEDPVAMHSPKRVVFEMSKTQIQPFRKFDKSSAVSASPGNVAFDPRKTPDFGLLKKTKNRKRKSAADFFDIQ